MHEIRMAHPAKNALGIDLIAWLEEELARAGDEPILLTGSEDAFCAGLNLKEVGAADAATLEVLLSRLDGVAARLFEHPAPTAAWVNGHAIAGGCVLVQCCDYRVAEEAERLRIGLNEVALGACFPPAILRIVRHRIAPQHAEEVLLGAGLYDGEGALSKGLVDAVTPGAGAAARAWLERAAAHPRRSYALTKTVLRAGVAAISAEDERRFRDEELALWTSPEVKQRIAAVLAR